jgi:hypothetical protein
VEGREAGWEAGKVGEGWAEVGVEARAGEDWAGGMAGLRHGSLTPSGEPVLSLRRSFTHADMQTDCCSTGLAALPSQSRP